MTREILVIVLTLIAAGWVFWQFLGWYRAFAIARHQRGIHRLERERDAANRILERNAWDPDDPEEAAIAKKLGLGEKS